MTINKNLEGSTLTISLIGRLDTVTSPTLESEVSGKLNDVTKLIFDFEQLEYISSAGLRVLLSCQKIMNKQGEMIIRNANEMILEIFEVTGFSDILTLE